jgi:hypothetical protein
VEEKVPSHKPNLRPLPRNLIQYGLVTRPRFLPTSFAWRINPRLMSKTSPSRGWESDAQARLSPLSPRRRGFAGIAAVGDSRSELSTARRSESGKNDRYAYLNRIESSSPGPFSWTLNQGSLLRNSACTRSRRRGAIKTCFLPLSGTACRHFRSDYSTISASRRGVGVRTSWSARARPVFR